MADREKLFDRFDVWLAEAERLEQKLAREGYVTIRALIDPETFPDWCRANGLEQIDGKARTAFANAVAYRHASGTH